MGCHLARFLLAGFLFLGAPALAVPASAPAAERTLAPGTDIAWTFEHDRAAQRFRSGDLTLTLVGRTNADDPELHHLVLTVATPGTAPVTLEGNDTPAGMEHHVAVGQWDAQRRYVLLQSFSGGAHCCNSVHVVLPQDGALHVVDLGDWDGDALGSMPTDIDGDGKIDFVFVDNRFLYAFASYAESIAPPQVFHIENGRAVDVSASGRYRRLFEDFATQARQSCVGRDPQANPNAACAAYVAAAARLGNFDTAWGEMLRSYQRDSDWELPVGCKVEVPDQQACPQAQVIHYRDYPDALRNFLVENGYIAR
jgi:hypothetical protein